MGHGSEGIGDEIEKYLLELERISDNERKIRRKSGRNSHLFSGEDGGQEVQESLHQLGDIERLQNRLQGRQGREDRLKDRHHAGDLGLDNPQAVHRFPVQVAFLEEELDVAGDGMERGADLVSHHGGQLPRHRQSLRPAELLLKLEKVGISPAKLLVAGSQVPSRPFYLDLELPVKICDSVRELHVLFVARMDPPQHSGEAFGQPF